MEGLEAGEEGGLTPGSGCVHEPDIVRHTSLESDLLYMCMRIRAKVW